MSRSWITIDPQRRTHMDHTILIHPDKARDSIALDMSTLPSPIRLPPADVERASERDGKHYELIDGQLKEKSVGAKALYIALRIAQRLNALYDPAQGVALVEPMVYCFDRPNHGRKPDVALFWKRRLPGGQIPEGDFHIAPDLAVEV